MRGWECREEELIASIQREILSSLGWNHHIKAKELFINLHSWFNVLKKGEQELLPEIKRLELDKIVDTQERMEAFASIRPKLCAVLDNVRTELMKSPVVPYVPNLSPFAKYVFLTPTPVHYN